MDLKTLSFIVCSLISTSLIAQLSASQLIDKSIDFHDPNGNWNNLEATLSFRVEIPDKPDRRRKVHIDNKNQSFSFLAIYKEGLLNYTVVKGAGSAQWNSSPTIPEEFVKKYRISTDRALMYKNYYSYLYGMPMKIKDPGSIIDPMIKEVKFYGKNYYRIRVTYLPEVGDDIWYFYFNKETFALEAYQFFHDESKNDGEYILFEGLKEIDGVQIPQNRYWYYNSDNKYLAADILE